MNPNLIYIPNKIKVGYQNRNDTYTEKLAYIIYYDEKNILRKEKSWETWRDKTIEPSEFKNVPIEGFVLNKKVGDTIYWNPQQTYIRIFDPRGFEFEISVANLLFILQETSCVKGKGLEGEFIYAWDKKDLILFPVNCNNYKNAIDFSNLKSKFINPQSMVEGGVYKDKSLRILIYLGKLKFYSQLKYKKEWGHWRDLPILNIHVFINSNTNEIVAMNKLTHISECISSVPIDNYAELYDVFYKSIYGSKIIGIRTEDLDISNITLPAYHRNYAYTFENEEIRSYYVADNFFHIRYSHSYFLQDGIITRTYIEQDELSDSQIRSNLKIVYLKFESGTEITLHDLESM